MNLPVIMGIMLLWLASLIGVGHWQHGAGIDQQKAADQKQFDKINTDIAEQKAQAGRMLVSALEKIIALQIARDEFKNQLEADHVKRQEITNDLRNKHGGLGLHFNAPQAPGCRLGGANPLPSAPNPTSAPATAVIELPAAITRDLRQLEFEADQLADNYRLCYDYARGVK